MFLCSNIPKLKHFLFRNIFPLIRYRFSKNTNRRNYFPGSPFRLYIETAHTIHYIRSQLLWLQILLIGCTYFRRLSRSSPTHTRTHCTYRAYYISIINIYMLKRTYDDDDDDDEIQLRDQGRLQVLGRRAMPINARNPVAK